MGQEMLVVLGHRNDAGGGLSDDALARVHRAEQYLAAHANPAAVLVVTTGGYGAFNRSPRPHAELLREAFSPEALRGAKTACVTDCTHTVEDALGVRKLLRAAPGQHGAVTVVTSGYHRARVATIFGAVIRDIAPSVIADERTGTLRQRLHEWLARRRLATELVRLPSEINTSHEVGESLLGELRHYDNISYFPLLAAFTVVYVWLATVRAFDGSRMAWAMLALCVLLSGLLLSVYLRLSGVAASARRVFQCWAYLADWPNIGWTANRAARITWRVDHMATAALALAWIGALCVRASNLLQS